ncbi:hypothetical protein DQ04_01191090 [Trypanosoma grayi]|uniref:hypothetical protein n=1 Tax=Trypanosoma grayi TaxID=71804 RepID=UPI0004F46A5A|nr:hypothetical protein DQ04_01191090 [Trypanosoma grayi]KEG13141.1 hypothetical protein DQ04_01191090 [Trypanosoma grayi]
MMFSPPRLHSKPLRERRRSRILMVLLLVILGAIAWILLLPILYYWEERAGNESPGNELAVPTGTNHRPDVPSTPSPLPSGSSTPFFIDGNTARIAGSIVTPHIYPMHLQLPVKRSSVAAAIHEKQIHHQEQCWENAHLSPLFPSPSNDMIKFLQPMRDEAVDAKLQEEYQFSRQSSADSHTGNFTFYSGYDASPGMDINSAFPWWVSKNPHHLPCTAEVQKRLYEYQNHKECEERMFLLSDTKHKSFGLGGALIVVAFDFLSAIILGRTLSIGAPTSGEKWSFAPEGCWKSGRKALDCFYLQPTRCTLPEERVHVVHKGSRAALTRARVIRKDSVDTRGLGRERVPSDEAFFGPGHQQWACYPEYLNWVKDPVNMVVQGSFGNGADARLNYMLAQAFMYITRAPQPWFQAMLQHHLEPLTLITPPGTRKDTTHTSTSCTIYVQDRGEIGKMREYYNVFGCHTVGLSLYRDYVRAISTSTYSASAQTNCRVFISGGTPLQSYMWLKKQLESESHHVMSTWNLTTLAAGAESVRWGASSPAASWVDMYAGVASTNWVCMIQSNWCRTINFLRMTHGRMACGFVDIGALLLTSVEVREKYCVVSNFPTKPFSNLVKK